MLIDDGWFDWTIRDPGPADRVLSAFRCPVSVYVEHSMEGTYTPGGYIVLRDPETFPTAWHWTKKRDGKVYQHYPIQAHLQHGHAANILGPGGELEGFRGEPITDAQLSSELRIIDDINAWLRRHGKPELVRDPEKRPQGTKRGLVEHREMAPQSNTTLCPSERYAPLWAALEGTDVTTQEYETLLLACFSGKEEASLPYEQRLTNAIYRATETAEGRRPSIAEMAAAVTEHEHGGVKR